MKSHLVEILNKAIINIIIIIIIIIILLLLLLLLLLLNLSLKRRRLTISKKLCLMIFCSFVLRHLCPEHEVNAHTGITALFTNM